MELQAISNAPLPPSIFIVEDESVVAKDIEKSLLELGYRVLGRARNATVALLKAALLKPDLILMDIGLPGGVDGVAAATAIHQKTSIPVVFLTGSCDPETLARARGSDAFGYIVKPFRQVELRGVIEIALQKCRGEAHARARERLLLTTLQSIGEGVVATNEREEVTFLNATAERLTGWSNAEAAGRKLADVMPLRNESTREPVAPLRQALDERRTTCLPKGTLLVGRKQTLAIDDSAAPIVAEEANLLGGVVVFRDASERQRIEEQLRAYQKMEVLGQLTGAIIHDFNNVLSGILLYSRFLAESLAEEDPRREDALEIEKAGKRGAALTRQLLAFTRNQALDAASLSMNEVITDLEPMLGRLLGSDIELTFIGEPELGCVTADRGQLEQVIVNLVVNARDAMPNGGTLRIETRNVELVSGEDACRDVHPGSYVMLVTSDNGCGMDAETQARAFEPFFTTKERARGTGLGLSSCYDIVKQSGGDIRLVSEVGQGTVFRVYLPRTDGRPSTYPPELAAREMVDGTETILLIEDETTLREAVARMLESCGYRVLRVGHAGEACAIAARQAGPIHLILSDVIARGIDRGKPLIELKALHPTARVLFMSGYVDGVARLHETMRKGLNVIEKPFSSDALARKVRGVLDQCSF